MTRRTSGSVLLLLASLVGAGLWAVCAAAASGGGGSPLGPASSSPRSGLTGAAGSPPAIASHSVASSAVAMTANPPGAAVPDASAKPSDSGEALAATPELLALGKQVYGQQCIACHGPNGDGQGEAAYLLYPKPRDFTAGKFILVSTWDRVPTDRDLFQTISRGMPGSAMPSWGHLPERTRWALVHYIKSFVKEPWEIKPDSSPAEAGTLGTGTIRIPPEPPYDDAARAKAASRFADACASCHGPTGRGDGVTVQFDDKGYPTRPRDLTLGVFKGDPTPENLFRRIVAGMPGTPMPMSDWSYGEDAWHLVHFIRSLSSDEQRSRAEMKKFQIVARRVDRLPDHPDSGLWATATPVNLHLMPLWWRSERPEELTVRALHDGRELAVQLTWYDPTDDHTAMRIQDFRDAVAVEFALAPDPPFFAMGALHKFVNIWMWKSERQADLDPAFQDLEKVYPNIGIDSYPNSLRSALEQPVRGALTLESDPTYVTAWGAGNVVADPTRKSASEDLYAQGFGTLRARPGSGASDVQAKGVWSNDTYRVILRRSLQVPASAPPVPPAVGFAPGQTVPVAFAVWNGTAGDRDGKKSVTIWQELRLEP